MTRGARLLVLALTAALAAAPGSRLESKVKRLLAASPVMRDGYAGILVADENGRRVFALNAGHVFVPASNMKLFTSALALERLGPDKKFETRVEQRGQDLVLIGTGDANLSGRVLPYVYGSTPGPALTAIDDLAAQIAARGVHEVAGDVVGDDTAFLYEPYAAGWAVEDALYSDGAPVSALVVDDNAIAVHIIAGAQDGAPVTIQTDPPLDLFAMENHALTGKPDDIQTDRILQTNAWRIWGTLPVGSPDHVERWAVTDPAVFAAAALKYALEQHGVKVMGNARALHRLPGSPFAAAAAGTVVARHESLPLVEDLRLTDKISQNLHAELWLSDVGGSREEGLKELARFLDGIGVGSGQYRFYDGSGLSRMDLVSPEATVKLLFYMATSSPHREDWMTLLPVGGVDGSLATRMTGAKVKGRIHAKTGSLNHVSALSGYAFSRKGRRLTFSMFVNNATADVAEQRELIDKICAVLAE